MYDKSQLMRGIMEGCILSIIGREKDIWLRNCRAVERKWLFGGEGGNNLPAFAPFGKNEE